VDLGKNVSFAVSASSSASPLTFQWFFNRLELPGATNRTLALTTVVPAMTGDYLIVLSDATGSVTSQVAQNSVLYESLVNRVPAFYSHWCAAARQANARLAGQPD
jgi:hypothetical protein